VRSSGMPSSRRGRSRSTRATAADTRGKVHCGRSARTPSGRRGRRR
jgi:hypothetical protein